MVKKHTDNNTHERIVELWRKLPQDGKESLISSLINDTECAKRPQGTPMSWTPAYMTRPAQDEATA